MKTKASKIDIAVRQLETAIDLFIGRKDYISAITLAGASEEILGSLLKRNVSEKTAVEELQLLAKQKLFPEMSEKKVRDDYLNLTRNMLKHANNPNEDVVSFHPREEALCIISRAIFNMKLLTKAIPKKYDEFVRIRNSDPLMSLEECSI